MKTKGIQKLVHMIENNYLSEDQTYEVGEFSASYMLDWRLISRIYKQLKQTKEKRKSEQIIKPQTKLRHKTEFWKGEL